jgi:hypothetical protein
MTTRLFESTTWEKLSQILYDLATTGKSTVLELLHDKNDYRFINRLERAGYIEKDKVVVMKSIPILLVRLSSKGMKVCHSLGWEVHESEWSRLNRLHEKGNGSKNHSAAILWFAYQARRRNWKIEVMPDLGDPYIKPDAVASKKSQIVHVEVEMDAHRNWEKWGSVGRFANSERSHLGICSLTPSKRTSLIREAKWMGIGGMATDLQTLSQRGNNTILWLENWNGI